MSSPSDGIRIAWNAVTERLAAVRERAIAPGGLVALAAG